METGHALTVHHGMWPLLGKKQSTNKTQILFISQFSILIHIFSMKNEETLLTKRANNADIANSLLIIIIILKYILGEKCKDASFVFA